MNKKNIVNSILISFLVLMSLCFVFGSGITAGNGKNTFYNVTDNGGSVDKASAFWNKATNYTVNYSRLSSITFNFTINNSGTTFLGNISNITIAFPNLFEIGTLGAGSNSSCPAGVLPGFKVTRTAVGTIVFFNDTFGGLTGTNVTSAGGNSSDSGNSAWSNCTFFVNVSVNGTGNRPSTETTGSITLTAINSSGSSSALTFTVGVDSVGPAISGINASTDVISGNLNANVIVHSSTSLGAVTQVATFNNASNITIRATIADVNLNKSNVTLWYNYTGLASIDKGNTTRMTSSACSVNAVTLVETCSFNATIPIISASVGGVGKVSAGNNISFIIVAADYFGSTSNDTNSQKGYNFTIRNTANSPMINLPDAKFIVFREYTISCDGDISTTELSDSTDSITICTSDSAGCSGIYKPTTPGEKTIQCITTDASGNQQTTTVDINVYSRSSSMSVSTGDNTPIIPVTPTTLDISTATQEATGIATGQSIPFKYETKDHSLVLDKIDVTGGTAAFTIDGKVSSTLDVGASKEIDIDGDGIKDVKVTLNKLVLNKADISLEVLAGATAEPAQETTQPTPKSSLTWLWVLLGVVVLVGIVWAVVAKKKK